MPLHLSSCLRLVSPESWKRTTSIFPRLKLSTFIFSRRESSFLISDLYSHCQLSFLGAYTSYLIMTTPLPPPSVFPTGYLEENHGTRVLVATSVILVLSTTLLVLRLYARTLTSASRGWDEWILIPAWFFLLGLIICLYLDVIQAGLGQHIVSVEYQSPAKVELFLKLLYTLDWFYVPANALSRVSVILLYLRIFTHTWARVACWIVLVFLVANAVQAIVSANLECFPLSFSWDKTIEGTCFSQLAWYEWTNIPNVIGDVAILLLPLRTVWDLKASTARKMGIAGVCLTGSM